MSERRTDQRVSQVLTAWMDDVAPDRVPSRLLEGTFARTMKTRQAPTYPWHRLGGGAPQRLGAGMGARTAVSARTGVLVLAALVVAALAFGLVAGGFKLVPPPSPSPTLQPAPTVPPTQAPLPSPIAVTPEAVIPVSPPIAIVTAGSAIWTLGAGVLDRIDPSTNTVTASVTLGSPTDLYNGLAANDAGLWATDSDSKMLYRVDPASLKLVASIPAGLAPKGVLASADGVWVADVHDGKVLRIDPATNTIVATIIVGPTGSSGPNWLASGLGSIWVNIPNNSTVVRIDPVSNAIQATIHIPPTVVPCGGFDFETTVVWVTGCGGMTVMAGIDPATNTVFGTRNPSTFDLNLARINGATWFSMDTRDAQTGKLVRWDPATNAFDRVLIPSGSFGGGGGMLVLAGSVWVVDGYNNHVLRLPLAAFAP